MNKKFKILLFIFILMLVLMPVLSSAQWEGLVKCGRGADIAPNGEILRPADPECTFKDIIILVNTIVEFIFFKLVVPIAAIMFFYAGFLMITTGRESDSSRTTAKKIFTNAVIGLILAAAAWLIVNTLLSILGYRGSWIGF